MELWPAIDILQGRCVRLRQGDYRQPTLFSPDPVQMAVHWVEQGAQRLHLVDLDAARSGRPVNADVVRRILQEVQVPCQVGGGIRSQEAIQQWLELGVSRLVCGTQALRDPDWFAQMCQQYPQRLVLGIDARAGRVAIQGWQETSQVLATDLARQVQSLPVAAIVYTDIERDGMMQGPNFPAIEQMVRCTRVPVIASGGISSVEDLRRLRGLGVAGCIVGRALYQGAFTLAEALQAAGQEE